MSQDSKPAQSPTSGAEDSGAASPIDTSEQSDAAAKMDASPSSSPAPADGVGVPTDNTSAATASASAPADSASAPADGASAPADGASASADSASAPADSERPQPSADTSSPAPAPAPADTATGLSSSDGAVSPAPAPAPAPAGARSAPSVLKKPLLHFLTTRGVASNSLCATFESYVQMYQDDPEKLYFLQSLVNFYVALRRPLLLLRAPVLNSRIIDIYRLYTIVTEHGGLKKVVDDKKMKDVLNRMNIELPATATSASHMLKLRYEEYLLPYEQAAMFNTNISPMAQPRILRTSSAKLAELATRDSTAIRSKYAPSPQQLRMHDAAMEQQRRLLARATVERHVPQPSAANIAEHVCQALRQAFEVIGKKSPSQVAPFQSDPNMFHSKAKRPAPGVTTEYLPPARKRLDNRQETLRRVAKLSLRESLNNVIRALDSNSLHDIVWGLNYLLALTDQPAHGGEPASKKKGKNTDRDDLVLQEHPKLFFALMRQFEASEPGIPGAKSFERYADSSSSGSRELHAEYAPVAPRPWGDNQVFSLRFSEAAWITTDEATHKMSKFSAGGNGSKVNLGSASKLDKAASELPQLLHVQHVLGIFLNFASNLLNSKFLASNAQFLYHLFRVVRVSDAAVQDLAARVVQRIGFDIDLSGASLVSYDPDLQVTQVPRPFHVVISASAEQQRETNQGTVKWLGKKRKTSNFDIQAPREMNAAVIAMMVTVCNANDFGLSDYLKLHSTTTAVGWKHAISTLSKHRQQTLVPLQLISALSILSLNNATTKHGSITQYLKPPGKLSRPFFLSLVSFLIPLVVLCVATNEHQPNKELYPKPAAIARSNERRMLLSLGDRHPRQAVEIALGFESLQFLYRVLKRSTTLCSAVLKWCPHFLNLISSVLVYEGAHSEIPLLAASLLGVFTSDTGELVQHAWGSPVLENNLLTAASRFSEDSENSILFQKISILLGFLPELIHP